MVTTEYHRNVHRITLEPNYSEPISILRLSDIHFDIPKCDRGLLVRHLDYAVRHSCPILINGDFFCLMQGKYDPRRSKKDILPQHNKVNYLDAVIEEAVEWWLPYHHLMTVVGYGNHETAIIKNVETDPLQRFVDMINYRAGTDHKIYTGGYGGWINLYIQKSTSCFSKWLYYYHGSGGGGEVTKGVIQNQRQMAQIEGADIIWMGHVHELYAMQHTIKSVHTTTMKPILKDVWHVRTATYKEEFGDGYMGYHVEKGRPPKPLGGAILDLTLYHEKDKRKISTSVRFLTK